MHFTKIFFVVFLAFAMFGLGASNPDPKIPVGGLKKVGKAVQGVIGAIGAIGTGKEIYDAHKNQQG